MRSIRLSLVLVALLVTSVAHAQSDAFAEKHLVAGQRLYEEGRYTEAIDELKAGLVLSPQPRLLFALGQAYRHDHQCVLAVRAYRRFLAADVSTKQAEMTRTNIALCVEEDPKSDEPEAVIPAAIVATPAPPPKPLYKRWWLWTTVGVVAAAGIAVGLGVGLTVGRWDSTLSTVGPRSSLPSQ